MATLQERIKERRTEKGFTLLDLATALNVKEATMQRYESGEIKNVKHETVVKLAEILNCSPQYLMGWVDVPNDMVVYSQPLTDKEQQLVASFKSLNEIGKTKAVEYVTDLADNPKYQMELREAEAPYIPSVLAAHHETGLPNEDDMEYIDAAIQFAGKLKRKNEEL